MRALTFFFFFRCVWRTPLTFGQRYWEMIEAGTYTLSDIQREAEAYFDREGRGQGSGYKQYRRWEYVASMELDEQGIKYPNQLLAQQARALRRAFREQERESDVFNGNWKSLGPTYWNATSSWNPGVGRITSIGLDPRNAEHIIVGSPTGGVWKTLDGGNTWEPLTDEFSTVDVYALESSPRNSDDYLWGSTSGRIYRSTDGGQTWSATSHVGGSGRVIRSSTTLPTPTPYTPCRSRTAYSARPTAATPGRPCRASAAGPVTTWSSSPVTPTPSIFPAPKCIDLPIAAPCSPPPATLTRLATPTR